jgi:hypothetical protein
MSVRFDTGIDWFVVDPDDCSGCGSPLYMSGCTALGCNSLGCEACGTGCDIEFVSAEDGGRCATALTGESDEDRAERINRERAAFGLSPASPTAGGAGVR